MVYLLTVCLATDIRSKVLTLDLCKINRHLLFLEVISINFSLMQEWPTSEKIVFFLPCIYLLLTRCTCCIGWSLVCFHVLHVSGWTDRYLDFTYFWVEKTKDSQVRKHTIKYLYYSTLIVQAYYWSSRTSISFSVKIPFKLWNIQVNTHFIHSSVCTCCSFNQYIN